MGESGSRREVSAAGLVSGSALEASPAVVLSFFFFLGFFFFAALPLEPPAPPSGASSSRTRSSSSSRRLSLSASANVHASLAHVCENIARATVFAAVSCIARFPAEISSLHARIFDSYSSPMALSLLRNLDGKTS